MIKKSMYLDMCDYVHCPLSVSEKTIIGKCTSDDGVYINSELYKAKMHVSSQYLTKSQELIIEMLQGIEILRNKNERGR